MIIRDENQSDDLESGNISTSPAAPVVPKKGASVFSSILSLTNCVVGAGVLSLPFAFRSAGIVTAQVLMIVCASFSAVGMLYVVHAGDHYHSYSYKGLAARAIGKKWAGVVAEACIILFSLFALLSYAIVAGDSLGEVLEAFGQHTSRWILVPPAIVLVSALACLPSLDFLKYVSAGALIGILVVFAAVVYHLSIDPHADIIARGPVRAWPQDPAEIMSTLGLFGMAYCAHIAVLSVYKEMNGHSDGPTGYNLLHEAEEEGPRRTKSMYNAIIACIVTTTLLYTLIGICGYVLFRDTTMSDLLLSFGAANISSWIVIAAHIAMCVVIVCSYPVVAFSFRKSTCELLFRGDMTPYWIQVLIVVGAGALALVLGGIGPDLGLVFQITGAIFGAAIIYAFPAIFHLAVGAARFKTGLITRARAMWMYKVPGYVGLVAAVLIVAVGLAGIIYSVI